MASQTKLENRVQSYPYGQELFFSKSKGIVSTIEYCSVMLLFKIFALDTFVLRKLSC